MWMAQGTASGMAPLLHWLGGGPKDLRWMETGKDFYQWIAKNEEHFVNEASVANLGVVWSQSTNVFYKGPGEAKPQIICRECIRHCSKADFSLISFTKTI